MNQIDLKNKNAVITGAAQGFGYAIAKRFALSGANLILIDKDESELNIAKESKENPLFIITDLKESRKL